MTARAWWWPRASPGMQARALAPELVLVLVLALTLAPVMAG